jgi:hypothetical protein
MPHAAAPVRNARNASLANNRGRSPPACNNQRARTLHGVMRADLAAFLVLTV